jgi:ankyrin repeat protein
VGYGWAADHFFNNAQVVQLCGAIEAGNTERIEELINDGVDIDAVGRENVTPLLWALMDSQFECFKLLLEHGANPNVEIHSHLNARGEIRPGDSVMHLAAGLHDIRYLETLLDTQGDVDLIAESFGNSVVHRVIASFVRDKEARIQLLVEHGCNLNVVNSSYFTPAIMAVRLGGQFDIAVTLLKSGADPLVWGGDMRLAHAVAQREFDRLGPWPPNKQHDLDELVILLEDAGESMEDARKDVVRRRELFDKFPPGKARTIFREEMREKKNEAEVRLATPME